MLASIINHRFKLIAFKSMVVFLGSNLVSLALGPASREGRYVTH